MFKKIKKSASDLFSSEKIGEVTQQEKKTNEITHIEDEIDPSVYIKTDKVGSGKSRSMIINELKLHKGSTLTPNLLTPEDVDNQEFTLTLPEGLSFEEVDAFCNIIMNSVDQYRNIIKLLEKEKELLIEEVLKIDRQALEERNQLQIDSILKQGNDEKERLQDSVINLQKDLVRLQKENKLLKSNNNEVEYKEENKKLQEKIKDLELKLENETSQQKDLEIKELKDTIQQLEKNINKASDSLISQKDEEIKSLNKRIQDQKELELKLTKTKEKLINKEQELNEVRQKINKEKNINESNEKINNEIKTRTSDEIEKELLNNDIDEKEAEVMEKYLIKQRNKISGANNSDLELLKKSDKTDLDYLPKE